MPCLPVGSGFVCQGRFTRHLVGERYKVGGRPFWIEWARGSGPIPCKPGGEPYRRVPRWVREAMERVCARKARER